MSLTRTTTENAENIQLTLSSRAGPAGPESVGAARTQEALRPCTNPPPPPHPKHLVLVDNVVLVRHILILKICSREACRGEILVRRDRVHKKESNEYTWKVTWRMFECQDIPRCTLTFQDSVAAG